MKEKKEDQHERMMTDMEPEKEGKRVSGRAMWLVFLQLILLLYATTSIFSKNAARYPFLSLPFLLFYAGMILVLALYALLWQQAIRHLPLTLAFANKAVNVVWGVVFGMAFFQEKISSLQAAGCALIIAGTVWYVKADQRQAAREAEERKEKQDGA